MDGQDDAKSISSLVHDLSSEGRVVSLGLWLTSSCWRLVANWIWDGMDLRWQCFRSRLVMVDRYSGVDDVRMLQRCFCLFMIPFRREVEEDLIKEEDVVKMWKSTTMRRIARRKRKSRALRLPVMFPNNWSPMLRLGMEERLICDIML